MCKHFVLPLNNLIFLCGMVGALAADGKRKIKMIKIFAALSRRLFHPAARLPF